jgi:uncharacterized protein with GYD domain
MLFCLTANYTHKALDAMRENPNTNRREAVEKMVTAAGGKLVEMYGTMAEGPGAMVIFDADLRQEQSPELRHQPTAFATSKCSVCSPGTK